MPESTQQKTEKPTQRRRRRAREQGTVAQSMEMNNALVLLAGTGALALFGAYTFQCIVGVMMESLGNLGGLELTQDGVVSSARSVFTVLVKAVSPVMVLVGTVGLLCSVAQTGILVVPKKLMPDLQAINPIRGLRNIFSLTAVMRLVTAVIKFGVIGLVCYLLIRSRLHWFGALVGKDAWGILDVGRRLSLSLLLRVVAIMLGVAVLDYAYQRWRYEKQLMMTKQELKEERKRDEGDPEVRGRQAQMRRAMAHRRMVQAVPEADVVVTNPTHLAVALQWDEEAMSAPTVVAKGQDFMATRIQQIAREHGVPVLERRNLARLLYQTVEVGAEIPPKLYYAVAEVLAYVLKKRRRRSG